jgi:hypothetical protein
MTWRGCITAGRNALKDPTVEKEKFEASMFFTLRGSQPENCGFLFDTLALSVSDFCNIGGVFCVLKIMVEV